jgi:hypothetical protein
MPNVMLTCVVAWLIPGGGHLMLGKWKRAILFFVGVILLFVLGLYQQGVLFGLTPGFFGLLKFYADLCIGLPYFLGRLFDWGAGDIRAYGYEYGNTYLYTAGLLNSLLVLDVFDIATGRKQ